MESLRVIRHRPLVFTAPQKPPRRPQRPRLRVRGARDDVCRNGKRIKKPQPHIGRRLRFLVAHHRRFGRQRFRFVVRRHKPHFQVLRREQGISQTLHQPQSPPFGIAERHKGRKGRVFPFRTIQTHRRETNFLNTRQVFHRNHDRRDVTCRLPIFKEGRGVIHPINLLVKYRFPDTRRPVHGIFSRSSRHRLFGNPRQRHLGCPPLAQGLCERIVRRGECRSDGRAVRLIIL